MSVTEALRQAEELGVITNNNQQQTEASAEPTVYNFSVYKWSKTRAAQRLILQVCSCVCVCMYYIYIYIYACMYVHTYVRTYVCMYVCICMYVRVCVCACVCLHVHTCVCV